VIENKPTVADAAVTDELATLLFGLELGGLATDAITARITQEVVSWAVARGWAVRAEARMLFPRSPVALQSGFVDVLVRRPYPDPHIAIEIDSTDKSWSLAKLQYAASHGMHAIWVRWGDDAWAGVHSDVDVIQLMARRRPDRRLRESDQLMLPI
jgi:hypothetical protein